MVPNLKTVSFENIMISHHFSSLVSALSDYAGLVTHNRIFPIVVVLASYWLEW